jgi:anti-sigma-K factor RskA
VTTHLDDELLARWALDDETPDAAAADHLRTCAQCTESLAGLRAIADSRGRLSPLEQPPAEVWDRITAELRAETAPARPDVRRPGGRYGVRMLVLAACIAAVLGIGAGIVGTLLATSDDQPAATVVRLEPLAGKSGNGSADLLNGGELKVSASGLAASQGFYEVWLINVDGKRMVSLGVLNPHDGGTFQIPTDVTAQGYRIIDISLEPNDGNPEHSHDSIIRGTLPS